jgi:hypothetical protein
VVSNGKRETPAQPTVRRKANVEAYRGEWRIGDSGGLLGACWGDPGIRITSVSEQMLVGLLKYRRS